MFLYEDVFQPNNYVIVALNFKCVCCPILHGVIFTSSHTTKRYSVLQKHVLKEFWIRTGAKVHLPTGQGRCGFGTSLNVLEWPSQSPDLNPFEHLWRDLKIAVQWLSPFNLTELERICREEWEKLPKYTCAKLVVLYPRNFEAVITANGASTK